jgi:hypothetical protein
VVSNHRFPLQRRRRFSFGGDALNEVETGRERITAQNGNVTNTLFFASLNGGNPTTFASISGTTLALVGWTTM